ncbi:hypothetical protein HW555_005186 [Spodoptera exigua]|uniref:Uncharacterized protein n=1 Tax=Spodoptera exigua TaxID=7107 RepID=A0A835GKY1_SPOEX|nr:hypothetical protein HW555_005186 [Spodoptera exigua]
MRKSLNSKQRQLRKSGNELLPNDAAELQRVSTEQQALQKHLEAARKQARQHSMLIQEYETKQRQQNPQLAQQSVINQQQITSNQTVFAQNQNIGQGQQVQQQGTINRPMQLGLQGATIQQQQTLIRTQQTVIGADGQPISQQRIGLVTSPLNAQGRLVTQGGRTLVIEQAGGPQPQLVRQLGGAGVQERGQAGPAMGQFAGRPAAAGARQPGARPAMSPLHVQSPLAPQSPLHQLTSPMQSPLHSQQSPLHHTSQSPLHPSTQSPLHTQHRQCTRNKLRCRSTPRCPSSRRCTRSNLQCICNSRRCTRNSLPCTRRCRLNTFCNNCKLRGPAPNYRRPAGVLRYINNRRFRVL